MALTASPTFTSRDTTTRRGLNLWVNCAVSSFRGFHKRSPWLAPPAATLWQSFPRAINRRGTVPLRALLFVVQRELISLSLRLPP